MKWWEIIKNNTTDSTKISKTLRNDKNMNKMQKQLHTITTYKITNQPKQEQCPKTKSRHLKWFTDKYVSILNTSC